MIAVAEKLGCFVNRILALAGVEAFSPFLESPVALGDLNSGKSGWSRSHATPRPPLLCVGSKVSVGVLQALPSNANESSQMLNSRTKLVSAAPSSWELMPYHSFPEFSQTLLHPRSHQLPGRNWPLVTPPWASLAPQSPVTSNPRTHASPSPFLSLSAAHRPLSLSAVSQAFQTNNSFLPAPTMYRAPLRGSPWQHPLILWILTTFF